MVFPIEIRSPDYHCRARQIIEIATRAGHLATKWGEMELVRAAALTCYFDVARELGIDTVPLLRKAGLTRSMLDNPERMLPANAVIGLLEDSARASGCETFGLMMAEKRKISDIGMVSLLIVHQPTLREAIGIVAEYRNRINSTLTLQLEDHEQVGFVREHIALSQPQIVRQVSDLALGVLYKMCRSIMAESWRPQCVCFSYPRPTSDRSIYDRLFDCPLQFGSDYDGIVIEQEDLNGPLPRADAALASHARELVRAVIDPGSHSVAEEVEQSIRLLMPSGRATIGEVAHSLDMNVRTLQRRLDQEGSSFSELLDRVRAQQVGQHFANRQLRLTDVAHLLGYSGLASFSAWYRARFNQTPSEGRRRLRRGESA
jgi:AraC-like DNA-binding protein